MRTILRPVYGIGVALLLSACNSNNDPTDPLNPDEDPKLTTVIAMASDSVLDIGQRLTLTASGKDQFSDNISISDLTWSTSTPAIITVNDSGFVNGLSAGTGKIIATSGDKSGEYTVRVKPIPAVVLNEAESSGGNPGDWVELYNNSDVAVDISGWVFKDNDDSHIYTLPTTTTIAAKGFLVLEESQFDFGLGGNESVRLFNKYGAVADSFSWAGHAPITYGRCADGVGTVIATFGSSKGAPNICESPAPTAEAWPGIGTDIVTVSAKDAYSSNMSGLVYEAGTGGKPDVLWASQNGPGRIFKLIWNGTIWTSDTENDWGAGKLVHYSNGTGEPDSEGITYAASSAGGLYISSERNNKSSSISKNVILRYDPAAAGTALSALNKWDITADIPVVGANLGIEAITWIPDTYLTASNFYDESKSKVYNPADYPNHADGLFFVGVEGNGNVYAYALNHSNNTFTRVATFASGFPGVMSLEFDRELNKLWVTCDDTCGNESAVFAIDGNAASSTYRKFKAVNVYSRPSTLPNVNNEGFALEYGSACIGGNRAVFWVDDNETDGYSIRRGSIRCEGM